MCHKLCFDVVLEALLKGRICHTSDGGIHFCGTAYYLVYQQDNTLGRFKKEHIQALASASHKFAVKSVRM